MATRRPLVVVSGVTEELPSGDSLDPSYVAKTVTTANSGSAVTLTNNALNVITLNAATPTITLPSGAAGDWIILVLVQDSTGGRLPSWSAGAGTLKWFPSNATPALTQTLSKRDSLYFLNDGTYWLGYVTGLNV